MESRTWRFLELRMRLNWPQTSTVEYVRWLTITSIVTSIFVASKSFFYNDYKTKKDPDFQRNLNPAKTRQLWSYCGPLNYLHNWLVYVKSEVPFCKTLQKCLAICRLFCHSVRSFKNSFLPIVWETRNRHPCLDFEHKYKTKSPKIGFQVIPRPLYIWLPV